MSDTTIPGGTWTLGDLTVTRFGYGAMQLAGPGVFGPPRDRHAALVVLREAVARGVNHIDTAAGYGNEAGVEDAVRPLVELRRRLARHDRDATDGQIEVSGVAGARDELAPDRALAVLPGSLGERRTIEERCERVAGLVNHRDQALIWCHLNEEGDLLEKLIRDGIQISGDDRDDE